MSRTSEPPALRKGQAHISSARWDLETDEHAHEARNKEAVMDCLNTQIDRDWKFPTPAMVRKKGVVILVAFDRVSSTVFVCR